MSRHTMDPELAKWDAERIAANKDDIAEARYFEKLVALGTEELQRRLALLHLDPSFQKHDHPLRWDFEIAMDEIASRA